MMSVLLLIVATMAAWTTATVVAVDRRVETPTRAFQRRALHSVAVIGKYLYIEGGEVSNVFDGIVNGTYSSAALNKTLSIALDKSFALSKAAFHEIPDHLPPPMNAFTLWTDVKNGIMYRYGGARAFIDAPVEENRNLFKFTPDNKGEGAWSIVEPSDNDNFKSLGLSTRGGAAFCTDEQLGFTLGGWGTDVTDSAFKGVKFPTNVKIPGMIRYDAAARSWSNESTLALIPGSGIFYTGKAVCVSGLTKNSIVLALGGVGDQYRDLGNITFYDTIQKKWRWQTATGDIPRFRENFCAAGVRSKGGTYEIIVHGGRNNADGSINDSFVLSLPGFNWFRTTLTGVNRMDHDCVALPNGQILISGGIAYEWDWSSNDVWSNSMAVVDMSTLQWSDQYNASAAEYVAAQPVRDWYSNGGMKSITWNSDEVKQLFAQASPSTTPVPTSTTPVPTTSPEEAKVSSTPVGTIVGAVVGGVAALCVTALIVMLWQRRRKKAKPVGPYPMPPELEKQRHGEELHGNTAPQEISGRPLHMFPQELPA